MIIKNFFTLLSMQTIQINQVVPCPIADTASPNSSIWFKNFSFERGKHYLVFAESGTGKSSFFDFLYGRRKDYKGSILFDNQDIKKYSTHHWNTVRKKEISLVFQGFRLFPELSVWENIQLKNKLTHHLSDEKIKAMLDTLGIPDKIHTPLQFLSYGQQQRVAVLRTLAQPFDFLLLDEPFSHLDKQNQQLICNLINQELHASGAGLILCSLGDEYFFSYNEKLQM